MATKPDTSGYERFSEVTDRLDEIIAAVRDKETSLERSLDLFDEAIALGTRAVDLVDKAAFSPEEKERLVTGPEQPGDAKANGGEAEQASAASEQTVEGAVAAERSAGDGDADGQQPATDSAEDAAQKPNEAAAVPEQDDANASSGNASERA